MDAHTDRQTAILSVAERQGRVTVEALAADMGVSPHTIRRDLKTLCAKGKLRRVHGGAERVDNGSNMPYAARSVLHLEAKRRIADAVADMVFDGASVFLSVGTTPAIIAHALARKDGLTVVTNNLNAAMALSENPTSRIILPGGELRLPDRDFIGPAALELFASYRADFGIFGVGGIDTDGSLLDFFESEVRARELIRQNNRVSILAADRSKFGRRIAAVGGSLHEADRIVLDRYPDDTHAGLLEPVCEKLTLADTTGGAA